MNMTTDDNQYACPCCGSEIKQEPVEPKCSWCGSVVDKEDDLVMWIMAYEHHFCCSNHLMRYYWW